MMGHLDDFLHLLPLKHKNDKSGELCFLETLSDVMSLPGTISHACLTRDGSVLM